MKKLLKKLWPRKGPQLSKLSPQEKEAFLNFVSLCEKTSRKEYASFDRLLWDLYPAFVRMGVSPQFQQDPDYQKKGYKEGIISRHHIDPVVSLLKKAQTRPIAHDDHDKEYTTHPDLRPYEQTLNTGLKLFVLNEELMKAIQPIIDELKEPVAACLGSPWRVVNVLCWETFPETLDKGLNEWHCDGLPFAVNKVMIYLSGASLEKGTTILKFADQTTYHAEGPIGTWMLFKVSEILHKGEKPRTGSRLVLEVRVVPSFTFDVRPYCAGFNAYYPIHPWHHLPIPG